MNAILVGPYLLGLLAGYVVLVIFTIRAVARSIARRRSLGSASPSARSAWLSAGPAALVTCTLLVSVGIASLVLFTPQPADDVEASRFVGTWRSTSRDAPGSIEIFEDGTVAVNELTLVIDRGLEPPEFRSVSGTGTWEQGGSSLEVSTRDNGEELSWNLGVYRNVIGGVQLQAITGDPDGPEFTQIFSKAS